jgi:osmotically-inducible protein OsmY
MKHVYTMAFILAMGAIFALAQTGTGQSSPSTPSTFPSQQQPGAQPPDHSAMGQAGAASSQASTKAQSDIQSALRKQLPASADNVTVSTTDDGRIQLTGVVASESEKQQVEQIARSAAPNAEIADRLTVTGSSNPGSLPPASNQPPSGGKPPMMRLVAFQQTGSASQDNPQNQSSPQTPVNPSSSDPGASANGNPGQTSQTGTSTSDVQDKVQKALQQDSSLSGANINVNVENNRVELTGTVASRDQKKTARDIAENNAGGMKVVDHLKVSSSTSTSTPSTPPKD